MRRTVTQELEAWAENPDRKPLMLFGARQVGKTWAMLDFGESHFRSTIRLDLAVDDWARGLFEQDLDVRRIISAVELRHGRRIIPDETLIVIDEIQEQPRAITSLKYFCEQAREYNVVAAGSYLGIAHHEGSSFPVGKVNMLTMRPMTFAEFLLAMGENAVFEALSAGQFDQVELAAKDKLEMLLKQYLVVGGMPEAVATLVKTRDFSRVREVQRALLAAYDGDFSKHAPLRIVERMRLVWNSLPSQLARENKKFVYGAVRSGARARDYDESIQWLRDYGVATKVPRVNALRQPLAAYEDLSAFKLFGLDVGLLGAMAELDPRAVLDGSRVFTEFKGAMTEQYVAQELLAAGLSPTYWSAERSTAEVDFAFSHGGKPIPVEVKAAENLKAKSLRVARQKFELPVAVRTSLSGYRDDGWLVNVPLWAIGWVDSILESRG